MSQPQKENAPKKQASKHEKKQARRNKPADKLGAPVLFFFCCLRWRRRSQPARGLLPACFSCCQLLPLNSYPRYPPIHRHTQIDIDID